MIDSNIKLSDWKALDEIQTLVESYSSGKRTDYDTLLAIKEVLGRFGFLND